MGLPQRPDQYSSDTPPALGAGPRSGLIRAFQVIIFGTGAGTGLFVYNGAPAKGSLVAAIVPPGGAGVDPYGNTVPAVANFGHWSAAGALLQHFGIDLNGDTFLANTSGLTVQHAHSANGATWFYNTSGEGLGNLIASIAPAAGTDLAGNSFAAGISSYDAFGGQAELFGSLFQLSSGLNILLKINPQGFVVYSPTAGAGNQVASIAPAAFTDANGNAILAGFTSYSGATLQAELQAAALSWSGTGITASPVVGSNASASLTLSSGQTAGNTVEAIVNLLTAATGAVSTVQVTSGALELTESTTPAADSAINAGPKLFGTTAGHLNIVSDSRNGDGQTYRAERIRQSTTSTQTFSLASSVAITGLSRTLGIGTYHVHVKVPYVPSGVIGSSHNLGLVFSGTATANVNGQCYQQQAANGVQVASLNGGTLASTVPSPTHVAFNGWMDLEADVVVTAAGTLTPNITLGTAGDNIITSAGTFWEINPES